VRVTGILALASMLAGTALFALWGCAPSGNDKAELHYRLTVEVETPQGVRSGSSVIWVQAVRNPNWVNPEGRGIRTKYRGEAVAVDLPNGMTLFALLRSESGDVDAPADWPVTSFRDILSEDADFVDDVRQLSGLGGSENVDPRPLPRTEHILPNGGQNIPALPLLVIFKDINDPKSVTRVAQDDLAASFGAGYRLKAITVKISQGPVTTGIEKKLAWLDNLENYRTDPNNPFTNRLPSEIGGLKVQ
jgi:hypothetical protein